MATPRTANVHLHPPAQSPICGFHCFYYDAEFRVWNLPLRRPMSGSTASWTTTGPGSKAASGRTVCWTVWMDGLGTTRPCRGLSRLRDAPSPTSSAPFSTRTFLPGRTTTRAIRTTIHHHRPGSGPRPGRTLPLADRLRGLRRPYSGGEGQDHRLVGRRCQAARHAPVCFPSLEVHLARLDRVAVSLGLSSPAACRPPAVGDRPRPILFRAGNSMRFRSPSRRLSAALGRSA